MRARLCSDQRDHPIAGTTPCRLLGRPRFFPWKSVCATVSVLAAVLALSVASSAAGAVAVGNQPGGGGFTWGVGIGANCQQVVEKIRRNWMDVRPVLAPDSRAMRPRSRDFFCVSPDYIREAMPKVVPMTTGLKCFAVQGQAFCCDNQHQQCAAM